mgnify:FL=1|jgi:hypothetical protein
MEKMLYFRDAADTTFCVPVSRMTKMETTNGTTVVMTFLPGNNELNTTAGGLKDTVTITLVTADTEKQCMKDILATINGHPHGTGFIEIADDVTGTFCSTTIASIVTALDT